MWVLNFGKNKIMYILILNLVALNFEKVSKKIGEVITISQKQSDHQGKKKKFCYCY
jgi:hypothetical protein